MPGKRLSMRKIKQVLRLKLDLKLSNQAVATSCGIGRTTVREYVRRAAGAGLSWSLPQDVTDSELEKLLFPPPLSIPASERSLPDWAEIHKELKRKGVTLFLLWQEYKEVHPAGYQYSRFCDLHRAWAGTVDLPMRQNHKAGEKLFVDYAGQTMPVVDPKSGEIREAPIFVAVSGASNYTYAVFGRRPMDTGTSQLYHHRTHRRRQDLPGLCPGAEGLPRRRLCTLPAPTTPLSGAIPRQGRRAIR